jgi:hypothetical protein
VIGLVVIPAHLWPATAGELYRILGAIPSDRRVLVTDTSDGIVRWVEL